MVLNIEKLTGGYSRTAVIHDISFNIKAGEIVGLIGLNGAGKSTTIKHILGLLNPQSGRIEVNGMEIAEDTEEYRRALAYIPESPILYEELTLNEHIDMTIMAYGLEEGAAWERAEKLLKVFRLDEKGEMFPTHFSKGMKQKVMLICAFIVEPDLYIIDEPFLGLDPLGIESLIELMVSERAEGRSILMSTHILSTAERYCDRYVILDDGRLLVSGTIDELRSELGMPGASLDELYLSLTGGAGSNESTPS
ncbi:ABC transporter ATP-binding protein [Salinicoccus halitifaciens]|uniref:ABC-2 type transport system ATP-binding protein n=1 Tax=Salinicoccus halitifaciens TaxID=1073415 RepID=A0ABV2E5C6_9STAP|nr:ABC transporter ATP-binding protein [Salinicoccus halitifaciens]MCD2137308.1 ABC transporter ATP-binding protein [Salinicoccus halitifaciens]